MSIEEQLAYRFRHSDDAKVRDAILKLLQARKFKRPTKAQQEAAYKRQRQKFSLAEKRLAATKAAEKLTQRLRKSVTPGSAMERKLVSSEVAATEILTNLLEQVEDDEASELIALFMKPKPSAQDIRKIASLVSRDARIFRRLASEGKAPLAIDVEPASRTIPFHIPSPHIRNEILEAVDDASQFEEKPSEPDEESEAEMEARIARERMAKHTKRESKRAESKWGDYLDEAIDEAIAAEIPIAPPLGDFKVAPAKRSPAKRAPAKREQKFDLSEFERELKQATAARTSRRANAPPIVARSVATPSEPPTRILSEIVEEAERRAKRRAAKRETKRAPTEDELMEQIRRDLGITRSSIERMEQPLPVDLAALERNLNPPVAPPSSIAFGSGRKRLTKKQMQVLKRMGVL